MKDNVIHVNIGEIKQGKKGDILKTTLGSCVGIAVIWKEKDVCVLAHCLLPESEAHAQTLGAKYTNQAVNSIFSMLKIKADDIPQLKVYLAGGGNMMSELKMKSPINSRIGELNIEAAKKNLSKAGLKFEVIDVGGNVARQMIVNADLETVEVIQVIKD